MTRRNPNPAKTSSKALARPGSSVTQMPIPPANRPEEEAASPYERGRQVREQVIEMGEEDNVLFLDPPEIFDPAIVGLTDGMGPLRVVYDCDRCVE